PTTNMWRTIPPLPTTGGTCQSDNGFVLDNELWVVGCLGLAINQQVWIYNSGTNSWRAGPPYNVDHQGPGAALFNARGFAVGGGAAGGGSTAVESIGPCGPTPTPTATPTASPSATPTATFTPTPTAPATATPTAPATATPTPTPTGTPAGCSTYTTGTGTGTITPGSTDTGSHCDDCNTTIALPFPISVYGQTFNSADVSSNGTLNLTGGSAAFTHGCLVLPNTFWEMAILPYQDDLRTDQFSGCSGFPGGTCGIFTSTTGSAPNRQFNIEWRAVHFADTTAAAN